MLERCAELIGRVTEQVFAEPEASVEVFLAADCGHSVDHERFVSSEARGGMSFLKKEALESGEDSSVKLLSA